MERGKEYAELADTRQGGSICQYQQFRRDSPTNISSPSTLYEFARSIPPNRQPKFPIAGPTSSSVSSIAALPYHSTYPSCTAASPPSTLFTTAPDTLQGIRTITFSNLAEDSVSSYCTIMLHPLASGLGQHVTEIGTDASSSAFHCHFSRAAAAFARNLKGTGSFVQILGLCLNYVEEQ